MAVYPGGTEPSRVLDFAGKTADLAGNQWEIGGSRVNRRTVPPIDEKSGKISPLGQHREPSPVFPACRLFNQRTVQNH